jgi:hypothetical protein
MARAPNFDLESPASAGLADGPSFRSELNTDQ